MNVIVRGFKTVEHAKEFIAWFEGQGEQDQYAWFYVKGMKSQNTDCRKTYPLHYDYDGNLILELQQ
jgi:hypothetical protein